MGQIVSNVVLKSPIYDKKKFIFGTFVLGFVVLLHLGITEVLWL